MKLDFKEKFQHKSAFSILSSNKKMESDLNIDNYIDT
jgi:hypothetical protein